MTDVEKQAFLKGYMKALKNYAWLNKDGILCVGNSRVCIEHTLEIAIKRVEKLLNMEYKENMGC